MTRDEFLDLLSRFAERPLPALAGRHVYLWHGDAQGLTTVLAPSLLRILDLHTLAATLPQSPRSNHTARRRLQTALRSYLADLGTLSHQQVLVVTGCDLLSRYQVPLGPFFEIASEQLMVVLVIPPSETYFRPSEPLPEYVVLDARAPFHYLCAALGERSVINTVEELP